MKKILLTLTILAATVSVQATSMGGFKGPGVQAISVTLQEAYDLKDNTPVILTGQITESLGDEMYVFTDASGAGNIEIDDEIWQGVTVTPNDVVIIEADVDQDFFGTEIDINTITIQK